MSKAPDNRTARDAAPASAVELLAVAYQALGDADQKEALTRFREIRLRRETAEETLTARFLSSLVKAAERAGRLPTPDDYKEARRELAEKGIELESLSRVIRHFGSWRRAKEALALSGTVTPLRIDARLRSRRLGKVWRYSEETLEETLRRCVDDLGRIPQVAEFEWWRQGELEQAKAEGNDALHLPSAGPYRGRFKTWERALLHFGYDIEEVARRLERP